MSANAALYAKAIHWCAALAIALAIIFSIEPASALSVPGTVDCKYDRQIADYFPNSPDQEAHKIDSIHVCSYSYDGHREAELVLTPEKSQAGVCVVRSVQYYLPPQNQGKLYQSPPANWERSHPHNWWDPLIDMQIATGECPLPGDANYIRSIDVPPGTFLELTKFWTALIAAPEKLEENFALVPSEKTGPLVTEVRSILTDPALLAKIHLQQVSLENQTGERFRGVPVFFLTFPSPNDRSAYYSLCLDWVDGKLKIIDVTLEFD